MDAGRASVYPRAAAARGVLLEDLLKERHMVPGNRRTGDPKPDDLNRTAVTNDPPGSGCYAIAATKPGTTDQLEVRLCAHGEPPPRVLYTLLTWIRQVEPTVKLYEFQACPICVEGGAGAVMREVEMEAHEGPAPGGHH